MLLILINIYNSLEADIAQIQCADFTISIITWASLDQSKINQ